MSGLLDKARRAVGWLLRLFFSPKSLPLHTKKCRYCQDQVARYKKVPSPSTHESLPCCCFEGFHYLCPQCNRTTRQLQDLVDEIEDDYEEETP